MLSIVTVLIVLGLVELAERHKPYRGLSVGAWSVADEANQVHPEVKVTPDRDDGL